jgi:hypothetical protein
MPLPLIVGAVLPVENLQPGDVLNTQPSTATNANINLAPGVDKTAPIPGDLWWNGTNLDFFNGTSTIDLLAGGGGVTSLNSLTGALNLAQGANFSVTISTVGTSIILDAPQDIRTTANPTFEGLNVGTLSLMVNSDIFCTAGFNVDTTSVLGTSSSTADVYLYLNAATAYNSGLIWESAGSSIWVCRREATSNDLRLYNYGTSSTTQRWFTTTGNVGFGTDADNGTDLVQIAGSAIVLAGTGTASVRVGGTLKTYPTPANSSGTTETDLLATSIPSNTWAADGDTIEVLYSWTTAIGATQTFKVYVAGTAIYTGSATTGGSIRVTFMRSSMAGKIAWEYSGVDSGVAVQNSGSLGGVTYSSANIIKCTGTTTIALDMITAQFGYLKYVPHN